MPSDYIRQLRIAYAPMPPVDTERFLIRRLAINAIVEDAQDAPAEFLPVASMLLCGFAGVRTYTITPEAPDEH